MPYSDYEYHKRRVRERYQQNPEAAAAYSREYRQKNRERILAQKREHYQLNKERLNAYDRSPERREMAREAFKKRYPKRTLEQKQKALLRIIKKRAKDRGLAFDLVYERIHWPTHCPVFGVPLTYGQRAEKGSWANGASVDRVDPKRGYTLDNIVVMSWRANRIKADATVEELQKLVSFLRILRIPCERKGEH